MRRRKGVQTLIWVVVLCLGCFMQAGAKDYNILDFGARSSKTNLNTKAIQAAIDACYKSGGGSVIIPKGTFVTGTLFLKSNITINMQAGAELFSSTSLDDYAEVPVATEEPHFSKCLFYVEGAENIKFIGDNVSEINGQGYYFKHSGERPKLFRIEKSRNIEFQNVTIKNSGSWCLVFSECDSIFINKVSVYNKENKNNDGIDFDGCSNVFVTDCNLQVEDDALCLKSSVDKICENINISNCTVSSYHAAVKFGTASKTGFRNVTIKDCQFFDCRYGAIKLLEVDGGVLENVDISNIKLYNCGGPIFLRLGNRGRTYDKSIKQVYSTDAKPEGRPVGQLRNITLRNIEGRLTARHDSTECIMLTGLPGHYIENIVLENINLSYSGHGNLDVSNRVIPEDEARYPEQSFFGVLPAYGMYLRHVKNLKVKNVTLQLRSHDARPAIIMDDVVQSTFENVRYAIHPEAGASIVIKNGQNLAFKKLIPYGKAPYLIAVQGTLSKNIQMEKTSLLQLEMKQVVTFSNGAAKNAVQVK